MDFSTETLIAAASSIFLSVIANFIYDYLRNDNQQIKETETIVKETNEIIHKENDLTNATTKKNWFERLTTLTKSKLILAIAIPTNIFVIYVITKINLEEDLKSTIIFFISLVLYFIIVLLRAIYSETFWLKSIAYYHGLYSATAGSFIFGYALLKGIFAKESNMERALYLLFCGLVFIVAIKESDNLSD